jgi:hypothetical protein
MAGTRNPKPGTIDARRNRRLSSYLGSCWSGRRGSLMVSVRSFGGNPGLRRPRVAGTVIYRLCLTSVRTTRKPVGGELPPGYPEGSLL